MQAVEITLMRASARSKRCTKCGVWKNIGEFGAHRKNKDGLDTQCKPCKRAQGRAYRLSNSGQVQEARRRHYEANSDRIKAKTAAWRASNPEAVLEEKRRYRKRHRPRINAYMRDYYSLNQDRCRSYVQNQRGRTAGTGGIISGDDIRDLYESQEGRCNWCGAQLHDEFEIDHVVPFARGGTNEITNIVISCTPCNRSKGNLLPDEWEGPDGR